MQKVREIEDPTARKQAYDELFTTTLQKCAEDAKINISKSAQPDKQQERNATIDKHYQDDIGGLPYLKLDPNFSEKDFVVVYSNELIGRCSEYKCYATSAMLNNNNKTVSSLKFPF